MIKEYRIKRGYTQEEIAELLRISVRQYQRIENNEKNPSITILKKIIKILKINDKDIAYIMKTFWEEQDKIEKSRKCDFCGKIGLISIDPEEHIYLCENCGNINIIKRH